MLNLNNIRHLTNNLIASSLRIIRESDLTTLHLHLLID